MLFGGAAEPLEDGPLEVVICQEVFHKKLSESGRRPVGKHSSTFFSNRSTNASGSSCGPIFTKGTWEIGGLGLRPGLPPAKTSVIHHALVLLLTAHLHVRSSIADFALQLPLAKLT